MHYTTVSLSELLSFVEDRSKQQHLSSVRLLYPCGTIFLAFSSTFLAPFATTYASFCHHSCLVIRAGNCVLKSEENTTFSGLFPKVEVESLICLAHQCLLPSVATSSKKANVEEVTQRTTSFLVCFNFVFVERHS